MRGSGWIVRAATWTFLLGACSGGQGGAGQRGSGGAVGAGSGGAKSGGAMGSGGDAAGTGGIVGTGGRGGDGGQSGSGGTINGRAGSGGAVVAATGGVTPGSGGLSGGGGVPGAGAGGAPAATGGAVGTGGAPPRTSMVVTSAEGAYWQPGTLTPVTGTASIVVSTSQTFQTFDGFGGSFTERGWSALSALSESDRARAVDLLFGVQGLRFTVGRIPIGASDFALDRYTLDVTDNTPDYALEKFSIARDRQNLIPYIQAALQVKPDLRLIADPWTPPVWMKMGPFSSSNMPSSYDGGSMMDQSVNLASYSSYLAKFVQEYAKEGITIAAVAPQADPTFQQTVPSCLWTPSLYTKFIRDYLGPEFLAQGLPTKLMLGMLANGSQDGQIASAVMADPSAKGFIASIGASNGMVSSLSTLTSYGVPVLQTEQDPGNDPFASTLRPVAAFSTVPANDYIFALQGWQQIYAWLNGGVTAYLVKHMALDTAGANLDVARVWPQDALLVVDTTMHALVLTPAYYVLRHVSQSIDPGAKRLGAKSSGSLQALAFRDPDGSVATVIYNPDAAAQTTISIDDVTWQFSIPGNGFATVVKGP